MENGKKETDRTPYDQIDKRSEADEFRAAGIIDREEHFKEKIAESEARRDDVIVERVLARINAGTRAVEEEPEKQVNEVAPPRLRVGEAFNMLMSAVDDWTSDKEDSQQNLIDTYVHLHEFATIGLDPEIETEMIRGQLTIEIMREMMAVLSRITF